MDNLNNKVDLLIVLVNELKKNINHLGQNQLLQKLDKAMFCLKAHDLVGLDIIKNSIETKIYIQSYVDKNINHNKSQILKLINEIKQDLKDKEIPISEPEKLFLNLSYNKFFDIFSEVYSKDFWERAPQYRLNRISQAFSVYNEILRHEPFQGVLKWMEKYRPPMESEISGSLFKFVRNILIHFPFFDSWDDIWVNKSLVNWNKPNQSIDRFLKKYCGKHEIEYRFKENSQYGFTYVTINFPEKYGEERIYLKDIIKEEEGVKFALIMMFRILNTQIESINEL